MVVLGGARFCGTQIIADRSPWLWDGRAWTRLPGEFPEAREDAQLAFDTRRNMLVSFGGRTRAGARSDTWEWNGSIWQLRSTGSDEPSPGPMEHAAMAYDARRSRVVLFGGGTRTGQMSGRTWEWDGRRWEMRSESGPAARVGHSMAFSPSDGVILYGGFNAGGSMRDLWKWDGSQWARLDSVGPTFTEGTSLVVTAEGPIVVGAGLSDSQPGMSRKSVWRWAGGRWQLLGERGPTLLVGQSVAYDPDRRRLVVFGGSLPNGNPLADVWELTDSGWLRVGPAR